MSRKWTARKTTTFDETSVDTAAYVALYPVFRAGPEPAVARKQVLRLLAGFALFGLPVHWGIGWLAGHSLSLAAAAVLVTAAGLFMVAVARYLELEELLQRLPLLILLGLVAVGLVIFTSLPTKGWGGSGAVLVAFVLILVTVVSVLGGLYRPLAAAYRTVTLTIPFRDLCVAATAMLLSLSLAALSQSLPRSVLQILTCALSGGLAGLVVTEYAAWARANPGRSLERVSEFDAAGEPGKTAACIDGSGAFIGAALFGLSFGLVGTLPQFIVTHAPTDAGSGAGPEPLLFPFCIVGLVGVPAGLIWVSAALNSLRLPHPFLALRLAWDALVVFLTYPETGHPLAHRMHTAWMRPLSVRLTCVLTVLAACATTIFSSPEKPSVAEPQKSAPAVAPPAPQMPTFPQFVPEGHWDAVRNDGGPSTHPPDLFDLQPRVFVPPPPAFGPAPGAGSGTDPKGPPVGPRVLLFVVTALAAVLVPPLFLYVMVWLAGAAALSTYFDHFEKPESPDTPR